MFIAINPISLLFHRITSQFFYIFFSYIMSYPLWFPVYNHGSSHSWRHQVTSQACRTCLCRVAASGSPGRTFHTVAWLSEKWRGGGSRIIREKTWGWWFSWLRGFSFFWDKDYGYEDWSHTEKIVFFSVFFCYGHQADFDKQNYILWEFQQPQHWGFDQWELKELGI